MEGSSWVKVGIGLGDRGESKVILSWLKSESSTPGWLFIVDKKYFMWSKE